MRYSLPRGTHVGKVWSRSSRASLSLCVSWSQACAALLVLLALLAVATAPCALAATTNVSGDVSSGHIPGNDEWIVRTSTTLNISGRIEGTGSLSQSGATAATTNQPRVSTHSWP